MMEICKGGSAHGLGPPQGFAAAAGRKRKGHMLWCCRQVLADFTSEDADVVFGVPEDALLEIGLPYRL